ncbi:MAG: D-amino-acid transaminase [Hyphomicrobiaceae bacterium]
MSRVVYVDGQYVPYARAGVHAEDRGFQFGDAVYEVCEIRDGRIVDERRHMARLDRSLNELRMTMPMTHAALSRVIRETVRRNRVNNGFVYLQVSRGAGPRDFLFPGPDVKQTVVCVARSQSRAMLDAAGAKGIAVITTRDQRWARVDIKTVMLLASCLAKQDAKEAGAKEAWFIGDDGFITEGASSNAWLVTKNGELVTRPADGHILNGITRTVVLDIAAKHGLTLIERPFTVDEAKASREAFITSATSCVMPVTQIDDTPVANGAAGSVATELRALFHTVAEIAA